MILESLLAFFGLIIGLVLARFTPEEFKSGEKYFILLYKSVLFLLIVYLLYFVEFNWWIIGLFPGALAGYFFRNVYFYLGLGYFATLNIYAAFLIFLFGLSWGTLMYHAKNFKKILLFSFILFFVSSFILLFKIPETLILSFVAGALFMFFIQKL